MKIDRKLNLVVPIEDDDGRVYAHVHSAPIGRETFERYFLVLSKAFTAIYTQGLGTTSGPRIAALLVKQIATEAGEWEGANGVERGLFAEVDRLTNVATAGPNGWETMPWREAVARGLFSDDDISEVRNAITFFIVASAIHRKQELKDILDSVGRLWSAQTTFLNVTEYALSLKTSTPVESTGAKAKASSIPS